MPSAAAPARSRTRWRMTGSQVAIVLVIASALPAGLQAAGGVDPPVTVPTVVNPLDANGLPSAPIRSLKGLAPLLPVGLEEYIADPLAAQQLGKALFWDTQVGSDGTACASCHFHAGADIRTKNQVNPGIKGNDFTFGLRASGAPGGPGQQYDASDFPFRKLADDTDRESAMTYDTNNTFSSQGTFGGDFVASNVASNMRGGKSKQKPSLRGNEDCSLTYNPLDAKHPNGSAFHANGVIYRKVEPRNTPTMINAVFNLRQFWDGRANNQFNGVDPFGRRTYIPEQQDPSAPVGYLVGNKSAKSTGIITYSPQVLPSLPPRISLRQPLIENASLASQAVGPPLSDFEMSCGGKTFGDLGRKVLAVKPLATQLVNPDDSLFSVTPALLNAGPVPGLNVKSYQDLVQKAFQPKYWQAPGKYTISPDGTPVRDWRGAGYTQMEHNFSLFWGLAIQAYEQLLISDDTPFDRYMSEKAVTGSSTAMSAAAVKGMDIFNGKGNCFECHAGAPLSSAAVTFDFNGLSPAPVEGMLMRDGHVAMYDGGFYNIGVRPAAEDIGNGGIDPYGFDLSYTRQYRWQLYAPGITPNAPDLFDVNRCTFPGQSGCLRIPDPIRDAVDGAFKAPQLRNVALTPPYFHNGGAATLKDVVRFYNRGGDRRTVAKFANNNADANGVVDTSGGDTSGLDGFTPFDTVNKTNLAPGIGEPLNATRRGLGLTEEEMDNLVEFLLALTDDRVACHSGMFDHPELPLAMGQKNFVKANSAFARDIVATLPATGQKLGLKAVAGECLPNSGDLFGTINKADPRKLQSVFRRVLRSNDPDLPSK